MNQEVLPNDQFTIRYGNLDDAAFHSVMALTPPSSPLETNDKERIETVTENVGNLVDEHFRNSLVPLKDFVPSEDKVC